MASSETIFALSSGQPPAAIAVIRISGPGAGNAIESLVGRSIAARRASLRTLRDPRNGELLDQALVLWFPGLDTATGEDLAELHCHGGRAVVRAVESVLASIPGVRAALPGEFTRRSFENGRIDLNEAEGLADLLSAETEGQRRSALQMAEGHFSRQLAQWEEQVIALAAGVEAELDFADEDDVSVAGEDILRQMAALSDIIGAELQRPSAERLRDGIRVVIAGPPNAGKSTLINALAERDVAIVSDIAGTTRDRIEVSVAIEGVALLLSDTAGLRNENEADPIEAIGIARASAAIAAADIVLWLGDVAKTPDGSHVLAVTAKADLESNSAGLAVSAKTGQGMDRLRHAILARARTLLPGESDYALNQRQRDGLIAVREALQAGRHSGDWLLVAEELRHAREALDRITGRAGTEAMLDALFGRFCIGK